MKKVGYFRVSSVCTIFLLQGYTSYLMVDSCLDVFISAIVNLQQNTLLYGLPSSVLSHQRRTDIK